MNRALSLLAGAVLLVGIYISVFYLTRSPSEPAGPATAPAGRSVVLPPGAPAPLAPYSPGIRAGDFVFLSGQLGMDAATGQLVAGGTVPQARQALANLRVLLTAAGLTFDDVVRATVYLADLDDYGAVNEVYGEVFTGPPPARVAVEVARLPRDARVEISMIAYGPPR